MKHPFRPRLFAGLLCLFISSGLFAQDEEIILPEIKITTTTTHANVSQKVNDAFHKRFKNATNVQWYQLSKNYLVDFITADMKNKALFQKSGYMVYHISYGRENNLPEDLRKVVKSNYVDYNITSAVNVKEGERNIWVVNLEDDKKMVVVRVEDGALEEINNLDKTM